MIKNKSTAIAYNLLKKTFISTTLMTTLAISGPTLAHGDSTQLRAEMKQMNWNLRRAAKSDNADKIKSYLIQMENHASNAREIGHNDHHPAIFEEGIIKLLKRIDGIQETLESGEIKKAKQQLKDLKSLKKEYHGKLDV